MIQQDSNPSSKDLVVVVPDNNMEAAVQGLLGRRESLGIRRVSSDVFVHVHRDPGVLRTSHELLRPLAAHYDRALVMFDREGCGREEPPELLAEQVQGNLDRSGWAGRSQVIVLDPELEVWVWSDSPHVASALGMSNRDLERLIEECFGSREEVKTTCPKEAMEQVLRSSCKPRSSSIYRELADRVSVQRCSDGAFLRLKACLREWFPRGEANADTRLAEG